MTGGEHCSHASQSVSCVEAVCNMEKMMIASAFVAGLTGAASASLVIVSHALFWAFNQGLLQSKKLGHRLYVPVHVFVCVSVGCLLHASLFPQSCSKQRPESAANCYNSGCAGLCLVLSLCVWTVLWLTSCPRDPQVGPIRACSSSCPYQLHPCCCCILLTSLFFLFASTCV